MTHTRVASLVALVVGSVLSVSACSSTPTSAPISAPAASRLAPAGAAKEFGDPPPPPVDTGSVAMTDAGTFSFESRYMLNGPDLAGFVEFSPQQPAGVSISPNARISFHRGVVSGKGTITFSGSGATIIVNLATAFSSKTAVFNPSCAQGCATLPFSGTIVLPEGVMRPTSGVIEIGAVPALTAGR